MNKSTQITEKDFGKKSIEEINKIVKYAHKNTSRGLLQQKLDLDSLHLRVYTDGSFADNPDLSTQLGCLILLCDKYGKCNVLHFSSYKSRRVVRSVLGSETYAFTDGMDFALILKKDIEDMIQKKIGIRIFTDSKSLFDAITKNSVTTEKSLMIDVQAMREAYERMEVSDLAWIKSEYNPSDALTKVKENAVLNKVLDDNVISRPVEQWVIILMIAQRKKTSKEPMLIYNRQSCTMFRIVNDPVLANLCVKKKGECREIMTSRQ